MSTDLIKSIEQMTPNGNRLELPQQQLANYAQVKRCLLDAGGKYKRCGFEFSESAATIKKLLVGGEAIDDKKKFQFFPTPPELVKQIRQLADIQSHHSVLEPSAGQGNLVDYIDCEALVLIELMEQNVNVLTRKGYGVIQKDFLTMTPKTLGKFDRIIANPPFTKNQDIDHIKHMFEFLLNGGRLVSLASRSWVQGTQKKQVAFREWLKEHNAEVREIPAGAFKQSGTNISTMMIIIDA